MGSLVQLKDLPADDADNRGFGVETKVSEIRPSRPLGRSSSRKNAPIRVYPRHPRAMDVAFSVWVPEFCAGAKNLESWCNSRRFRSVSVGGCAVAPRTYVQWLAGLGWTFASNRRVRCAIMLRHARKRHPRIDLPNLLNWGRGCACYFWPPVGKAGELCDCPILYGKTVDAAKFAVVADQG